jgi:hypothetical protein
MLRFLKQTVIIFHLCVSVVAQVSIDEQSHTGILQFLKIREDLRFAFNKIYIINWAIL